MHLHSCEDDYVVVDEPIRGKTRKLCGNQIPQSFNISSNELKIAFKSAERLGRPKPGFVATYTSGTTPGDLRILKTRFDVKLSSSSFKSFLIIKLKLLKQPLRAHFFSNWHGFALITTTRLRFNEIRAGKQDQ